MLQEKRKVSNKFLTKSTAYNQNGEYKNVVKTVLLYNVCGSNLDGLAERHLLPIGRGAQF